MVFSLTFPIMIETGFSNVLLLSESKYFYKSCRIFPFVALYHSCYVSWVSKVIPEAVVAFAIAVVMGWIFQCFKRGFNA